MNYAVFDTESTSVGATAEVIQFSAVLLKENLQVERITNFYCYTQEPIDPQAAEIHHLTPEFLMEQSRGKTFEDNFLQLDWIYKADLIWVGYNVGFDTRVVNNTLTRNGLPKYDFGKPVVRLSNQKGHRTFDLMRFYATLNNGYNRKLSVVAQSLPYSNEKLEALYKKFLTVVGSDISNPLTYHNALYDVMITWLLLYNIRAKCM